MFTTFPSEQRPGDRAAAAVNQDGHAWLVFSGIMLMMLGVINVIYGIAAINRANFFIADANYVISDIYGLVAHGGRGRA